LEGPILSGESKNHTYILIPNPQSILTVPPRRSLIGCKHHMIGYARIDVLGNEISTLSKSLSHSKLRQKIRSQRKPLKKKKIDPTTPMPSSSHNPSRPVAQQLKQQASIQHLLLAATEMKQNLSQTRKEVRALEHKLGDDPVSKSNLPDIIQASTARHLKEIHVTMDKKLLDFSKEWHTTIEKLSRKLNAVTKKKGKQTNFGGSPTDDAQRSRELGYNDTKDAFTSSNNDNNSYDDEFKRMARDEKMEKQRLKQQKTRDEAEGKKANKARELLQKQMEKDEEKRKNENDVLTTQLMSRMKDHVESELSVVHTSIDLVNTSINELRVMIQKMTTSGAVLSTVGVVPGIGQRKMKPKSNSSGGGGGGGGGVSSGSSMNSLSSLALDGNNEDNSMPAPWDEQQQQQHESHYDQEKKRSGHKGKKKQ
jgi:hypothetical protein